MSEPTPQRHSPYPRCLEGRVVTVTVTVTGVNRCIGPAIARRLVAEGARVCLTARNEEPPLEAMADAAWVTGVVLTMDAGLTTVGVAAKPSTARLCERCAALACTVEEKVDHPIGNIVATQRHLRPIPEDRPVEQVEQEPDKWSYLDRCLK